MVPQVGKQLLGIRHAQLGREQSGDALGECGEQAGQDFGVEVLQRCVEKRAGFGKEAGELLQSEGCVVVGGELPMAARRGLGGAAVESREPAGPVGLGWRGRRGRVRPARERF